LFVFLSSPCFEILLLLLFWRGGHASLFFICSFFGAHIFFLYGF
jgi:hypothetical protein